MKKSFVSKAAAIVLSAAAAFSFMAPAASAATIRNAPMHNQYGQPVNYNTRVVTPVRTTQTRVVTGVPIYLPSVLGSFSLGNYGQINTNITQAVYVSGNRQVIVRKARGATGMNANFPGVYRKTISGRSILLKGTNQGYFTAEWTCGAYNYSISTNTPMIYAQMEFLVSHLISA